MGGRGLTQIKGRYCECQSGASFFRDSPSTSHIDTGEIIFMKRFTVPLDIEGVF